MWFESAVAVPDPYQEAKPKLTQKEIENAAAVYKTFVDPKNQMLLYHVMRRKCHKDTFNKWWPLICYSSRNPVDHPYSVDQYIADKDLGHDTCNIQKCGKCKCE
tara:strand:+ start:2251 stop:2562 length:312 start_codon:yes stop_codon:yes gene_type:complete